MSLRISTNNNNKNSCLFQKRDDTFKKLFNLKYNNYQLIGDIKSEGEMKIKFLNSIISLKALKSSQRKRLNNNIKNNNQRYKTVSSSNMQNNHSNQLSLIKSNKERILTMDGINTMNNTMNNTLKSKEDDKKSNASNIKLSSRKTSVNIELQSNETNCDLLLDLYEKGMYDPQNPSHQRGTVVLNEKQKEKWQLTDYHHLVYATHINNYHPFCFCYGTRFSDLVKETGETLFPEGKLINYRDWQKEPDYTLNGILKGIEVNDKVGLVIVDPNVKKKYSGLVGDIIIQLLKVPFGHHMSLNVKIFEPKCLEERLTNVFSYANRYLIPASESSLTPYDRFKLVITFIMSGMYIPAQQLKPFNPFLGETFQGELPNGAKIYVEQVTHKPLCARFYMFYQKVYKIYGYFNFSVRSEGFGSTMYVCQHGPCTVEFPQIDERVTFNVPEIKIVNARSEEGRANLYSGCMCFVDIKNNFKAVIQFGFNKKLFHELRGCTFKCNYPPGYKYLFETEWKFGNKFKVEKFKNDANFIEEIKGSWINNLFIGNKLEWDSRAQVPEFIKPSKTCLPSDGRFREDLCWLYKSFYEAKNETERKTYEKISQEWKLLLEKFNRWERKRRDEYNERLMKG